jgi:ligand-binding sensor domain-containing protein/signal transduction histidine kinase
LVVNGRHTTDTTASVHFQRLAAPEQRSTQACVDIVFCLIMTSMFQQSARSTTGKGKPCCRLNMALRLGVLLSIALSTTSVPGDVLWSDLGSTLVKNNGAGEDILRGVLKRDNTASDTLYFKFHVDPLSDVSTERYSAGFQLFEGEAERLGLGNSWEAWAYSAFNTSETSHTNGDVDLHSARFERRLLETFDPYELVRHGIECTIVFKVHFVPGMDDDITVWVNPDLTSGVTEESQPETITTRLRANASFDQVRLRHEGGGGGWLFSDMAIATSFGDFVGNRARSLGFRLWQREQGLPQNSVHALAQTHDGYIWVGSDDGVARFDGVRFKSIGVREGLHSGRVRVLLGDSSSALWIGTVGGGLSRWRDGQLTTLTLQEGLPADSILALAEDGQRRIWVGTEAGLALIEDDHPVLLPATAQFKGKAINMLFRDRHGLMWLGAAGVGVFCFTNESFAPLEEPSVASVLQDPHCGLEDRAGRLWFGAGDDFVLCREGEQWRQYRIPRRLARPYVSALVEQADGTLWAGSVSEGLFQFNGGQLTPVNASSGLSDNLVESLLVDREGNLWVGTGAGLNRLRRKNLLMFAQNEGLGYGAVQGLAEVAPGIVWAGKPSDGLYRWNGQSFSRLSGDWSSRFPEIHALLAAQDGTCWVAAAQGLLHFTNPTADPPEAEPPMLEDRKVSALAEDRAHRLWGGTREGELWLRRAQTWERQTNFIQGHALVALAPEPAGGLWLGTEGGGLYGFNDGIQAHLDKHNGLLSDSVRALYLDEEGTLWIGTEGGGLSLWRQGHLTTFTTSEGLPDNTISQILQDDSDRLWLGSNRGLACVSKRELKDLSEGKSRKVYPQFFGRAEGMFSDECTGGFCPAGLKTKSGRLWFSTLKGVAVAEPPQTEDSTVPPVLLEEILVDDVAAHGGLANQAALTIGPGAHRLEFRYTALSFAAPERLLFRFRLEPLDRDWSQPDTSRMAKYSYVPPGQYRFSVTARNGGSGAWNSMPASLSFTVLPHFWQTWWFIGVAALSLVGSVSGAARLVEKRKLHRRLQYLEQERTLERERARIAQDLHDDLGASLTRVSLLSELVKADKDNPVQVETHAAKISQSARQTVRALDEIVWALRPGSDSLQSLIEYIAHFASELFEGDRAHCRLDLQHDLPERSLPPEMRHNLFLILKEALTNALKHASAREVHVQARAESDWLEFLIEDDGKGFRPQEAARAGKRQGLGNMRHRANALGGTLEIKSIPGSGTSVRLRVQFKTQ